ncbi:unnamed protein product [Blepharisma stoltei]|uniref:Uncharacterized protein n=1 Tax=Blepharisma stoltei TaxID=1481888 RepID=A0AAU9IZA0_9CILI|nr:unnamed protein product [Blepharisma stoltei]
MKSQELIDTPVFIYSDTTFETLREINEDASPNINYENLDDYTTLSKDEIQDIPGGWLYSRYTEQHIEKMRLFHILGVAFEAIGLLLGEALVASDTYHSVNSFSPQHFFILAGWIFILSLGIFFLYMLYSQTLASREIMVNQLGYLAFAVYALNSIYLSLRNFTELLFVNIICTVLLTALMIIVFRLHRRVKYEDDGRYVVSRSVFLGVHAKISLLLGWLLILFLHRIFICLSFSETSYNLLGWPNENWSILALCLAFAIGVIFMSTYKDVFYAISLVYSFIGIYVMQNHSHICKSVMQENCSEEVGTCAIALASIFLIFILITLIFYYDTVCYKKRRIVPSNL